MTTTPMNAAQARALFFQRKLNIQPITESLPDLAALDGLLSAMELPANEIIKSEKMAKGPDGSQDESLMLGFLIARSLVMTDSKERLFSDTDAQGIAGFGLTVLTPLGNEIKKICGMGVKRDAVKKSSTPTPSGDSVSLSPASLEATPETN